MAGAAFIAVTEPGLQFGLFFSFFAKGNDGSVNPKPPNNNRGQEAAVHWEGVALNAHFPNWIEPARLDLDENLSCHIKRSPQ